MKTKWMLFAAIVLAVSFSGCMSQYENVPPGYIGKVLTPSGWDAKIHGAGQVDIGTESVANMANSLVLLENSSLTVKEPFLGPEANEDKTDHRVVTADGTPLAVDIRVILQMPDFEGGDRQATDDLNKLFTLVTPVRQNGDPDRVMRINLELVYDKFVRIRTRGQVRQLFAVYPTPKDALEDINGLNKKIQGVIVETLMDGKVPIRVGDVQISNIAPDRVVRDAISMRSAVQQQVEAMRELATAVNEIPNGLSIYTLVTLRDLAQITGQNGNQLIVVPYQAPGMGNPMMAPMLDRAVKTASPPAALEPAPAPPAEAPLVQEQ